MGSTCADATSRGISLSTTHDDAREQAFVRAWIVSNRRECTSVRRRRRRRRRRACSFHCTSWLGDDWGARNIPSAEDDDVVDVRRAGASRCGDAGDDDDDDDDGDDARDDARASGGTSRCGGDAVADAIHG